MAETFIPNEIEGAPSPAVLFERMGLSRPAIGFYDAPDPRPFEPLEVPGLALVDRAEQPAKSGAVQVLGPDVMVRGQDQPTVGGGKVGRLSLCGEVEAQL